MESHSLPYAAVIIDELNMCVTAAKLMSSTTSLAWSLACTHTDLQTHTRQKHRSEQVEGGTRDCVTCVFRCACVSVCGGVSGAFC